MTDAQRVAAARVGEKLLWATGLLNDAGIERPQAEARILLEAASDRSRSQIIAFPEHRLTVPQEASFDAMVARRCAREPISRILGSREFWSLRFAVGPGTLDPRPDSETLVAAVLERFPDRSAPLTILDLGTGTGCLLLALLSELPRAQGVGVDISDAALETAVANADRLGLMARTDFRAGDWARDISAQFDVIVSNPPYIESAVIETLAPEVSQFDPRGALDGGPDGLACYRALLPQAGQQLKSEGLLALEIGSGQTEAVQALATQAGFRALGVARDLAGTERCLLFTH
jgi:release factor glutamine methyltransferase